jgi:hypothetical protein
MVCRITLNLRMSIYGPTTFERTHNDVPMGDLANARSGRSTQALESTATKNLQDHIREDYDHSSDYDHMVRFTNSDVPGTAHRRLEGDPVTFSNRAAV